MLVINEAYVWFMTSLFVLGVLLVPLGLSFLLIPEKMLRIGEKLNHWISTEHIFDSLNRPRFLERFVYRHHSIFGILVIAISTICIYMMLFYADISLIMYKLLLMVETEFSKWLLVSLYYILAGANVLAFMLGVIIVIRPSVLKTLEDKANHWFEAEEKLKVLDNTRDLPDSIFPGNPRIFGTLILIAALYILMNTKYILI
jgi:hypothetical protein